MFTDKQVNELHDSQKFHGDVTVVGNLMRSIQTGLTAGTTQTQAGAVVGAADLIRVSTTATASDGVKLPPALKGMMIAVTNAGAENLKVWPATDEKVNTGTANAADSTLLATTKTRFYFAFVDGDFTKINIE